MEYEQAEKLKKYIEQLQADAFEEGFKTAIEQGQRHGHWEHIDGTGWWTGWYRCSECGEKEKMKGSFQPYCRWCGAKMDEEVKDE